MPSRRHPLLIESIAAELARVGKLPHLGSLKLVGNGPTGEPGGNSAYRLQGVWNAFAVPESVVELVETHTGPILLIDDLADSRWTLTVAARLLRQAGAHSVLPFVLALRG